MITTHIELEEIEQKVETLDSLLSMLEKVFEGDNCDYYELLFPGIRHISELSGEVLKMLTELRLKYTKLSEADTNAK